MGADQWEPGDIPFFRFNSDAQEVFVEWITRLEREKLRNDELSPYLKEHFAKYRSLMPSLALIFHLITNVQRPILPRVGEQSARLAVRWCQYLESHAMRIYNGLGKFEQQAAYELSKKISALVLPETFKARDVQKKNWHLLNDRKAIDAAIAELVEAGWVKQLPQAEPVPGQVGRRPAPAYRINPKTRKFYATARS